MCGKSAETKDAYSQTPSGDPDSNSPNRESAQIVTTGEIKPALLI